jgi:aldose 1-epimerase
MAAIGRQRFGSADGKDVSLFTLTGPNGLIARITDYGGIVTELHTRDRKGRLGDIVLGFSDLEGYLRGHPYFGALVGRVGNRIGGARFELDGRTHRLAANEGRNHLHGGVRGFDKALWRAEAGETSDGPALRLHHVSPDGEEGYPGKLDIEAIYTLTGDDSLRLEITARSDAATPVNILHHSYWNLSARPGASVLDDELRLFAGAFTPMGPGLLPTGEIRPVADTPFDFTAAKPIGRDLDGAGSDPAGYDVNFVVDGPPDQLRPVARLQNPASGRVMEVCANQPGVQLYTGTYLDGSTSGKGSPHRRYAGLCLETQAFPDAINRADWRGQVVLRQDATYNHVVVHRFGVA